MMTASSPVLFSPSSSPAQPVPSRKRSNPDELPRHSKRRWADLLKANNSTIDKENIAPENQVHPEAGLNDVEAIAYPSIDDDLDFFTRPTQGLEPVKSPEVGAGLDRRHDNSPQNPFIAPKNICNAEADRFDVGKMRTTSGKTLRVRRRPSPKSISYEQLISNRSTTEVGKATRSYYGIDIHNLLEDAAKVPEKNLRPEVDAAPTIIQSIEAPARSKRFRTMLWTEKYRAHKFTDLIGDERTHRQVLRWLKGWDSIVFPGNSRPKQRSKPFEEPENERQQRKILLLTGPPGLGKTTLAHVCAKQAGYEVAEINASDERSRDVVKGKIRDIVGTENVRGVNIVQDGTAVRKAARPVCVVVDEVDGVVGGSGGGGEGGFIKALIDLALLDQRNSSGANGGLGSSKPRRTRKGDQFRLLRPIVLICNDIYHPSLRPLRSSSFAEIVHLRKPPFEKVVSRIKSVFEKEGISCESDGARRLCEAAWGLANHRERHAKSSAGEGDIRSVLVVAEWVAARLRASQRPDVHSPAKLTRRWVEQNILDSLSHNGSGARGLGRGGTKEVVERVFLEGAGFPKPTSSKSHAHDTSSSRQNPSVSTTLHISEPSKYHAMTRLREVIDTTGEPDRIISDSFTAYPSQPYQDDTYLSKPASAYEWLHFHDCLFSKVHTQQEWELNPYLSHSILGFHDLFASPGRGNIFSSAANNDHSKADHNRNEEKTSPSLPFTGSYAAYEASEVLKENRATLSSMHTTFSIPVFQSFRSPEAIATDLVPYLNNMLSLDVKPTIIGGHSGNDRSNAVISIRKQSERAKVESAAQVMAATGVNFERVRITDGGGSPGGGAAAAAGQQNSWIWRMEPPVDVLSHFETMTLTADAQASRAPTRYAVRQALVQELDKYLLRRNAETKREKYRALNPEEDGDDESSAVNSNETMVNKAPHLSSSAKISSNNKDVKRDFFGRIVDVGATTSSGGVVPGQGLHHRDDTTNAAAGGGNRKDGNVWVSFNEGYSNAVRKPITLEELMRGFF